LKHQSSIGFWLGHCQPVSFYNWISHPPWQPLEKQVIACATYKIPTREVTLFFFSIESLVKRLTVLLDEHTQPANLDTISKSQKEKGLMLHNVVYGQLKKWQPISKLLPRFVPVLDHGPEQRSESMNHSLVQNLLQMGWCIHHATRICRKQNTSVLRYLAGIKRTDVVGVSHDACSEQTCVAYHARIDDSYTVRHVQADCNCEFLVGLVAAEHLNTVVLSAIFNKFVD